jgi:hypothetical protein
MHTDGNFPAVLQVVAFLASGMLAGVLVLTSLYGFARRKIWARKTFAVLLAGAGLYFLLLAGFSIFSREQILPRGEEKYFCEMDCHLAYSISNVQWVGAGPQQKLAVTVRTWFDEKTISARRPQNAPLKPNPRRVVLVDPAGRVWAPMEIQGTPLEQPLIPGQSYTTAFIFPPVQQSGLRLLITSTDGPMVLLIGNEMSWGHKKTFLAL